MVVEDWPFYEMSAFFALFSDVLLWSENLHLLDLPLWKLCASIKHTAGHCGKHSLRSVGVVGVCCGPDTSHNSTSMLVGCGEFKVCSREVPTWSYAEYYKLALMCAM